MKFLDQAKIYIKAGNGGSGSSSFRREKYVEFGGPDGGDGGNGGSIILESERNLNTLVDFRYRQHFRAENGGSGSKKNKANFRNYSYASLLTQRYKMSSNKKQLLLFFVGILLIIVTYIIYPRIGEETRDQYLADKKKKEMESSDTTFENIKYEGFDANGNRFEIGSKVAKVESDNPNITYMETVNAYFYLQDGRVVTVKSLFATYNRETNDIFFKDEVVIDDGESQLYSDNLDIVMSSHFVKVYNSVRFSENANWMVADKIEIDLSKKISTISMYTDEQVKIKLKK